METKSYACFSRLDSVRANSSSGGIYALLAYNIICKGGVVFAACYDENLNVSHQMICNENDIIHSQDQNMWLRN